MLDYGSLAALAAVVREGSFDRAAAALGVTTSAVSQRVRSLEERLGSVLVVRGQPCTATSAGARICAHVERVRLLEGEMAADLPELAGEGRPEGPPTLRIAVNRDSLDTWFVPALAGFAAQSGALVDLVLDREELTTDRLRSGEVLAAVTDDAAAVQGCKKLSLGSLRYTATATPEYMRRWFPRGVTAAALEQAPVLIFDRRDNLQDRWAADHLHAKPGGNIHWMPATQAFLHATRAGLGWGMNPVRLIKDDLKSGSLAELLPGRHVDVALHWQYARIGARLLDVLTKEVMKAAKSSLLAPRSKAT